MKKNFPLLFFALLLLTTCTRRNGAANSTGPVAQGIIPERGIAESLKTALICRMDLVAMPIDTTERPAPTYHPRRIIALPASDAIRAYDVPE